MPVHDAVNYAGINKALAERFGDGNVELRKAGKDDPFVYVLWFRNDNTPKEDIREATKIVGEFSPSRWRYDLMRHVDSLEITK